MELSSLILAFILNGIFSCDTISPFENVNFKCYEKEFACSSNYTPKSLQKDCWNQINTLL